MGGSLGSGQVHYHEARPIVHFGSPGTQTEEADRLTRLRKQGFEVTERMPS